MEQACLHTATCGQQQQGAAVLGEVLQGEEVRGGRGGGGQQLRGVLASVAAQQHHARRGGPGGVVPPVSVYTGDSAL